MEQADGIVFCRIGRLTLHQLMEPVDGTMLAWNCDQRSVFERYSISGQFCPMAGQFCPTGNILILLRFSCFNQIRWTILSNSNIHAKFS